MSNMEAEQTSDIRAVARVGQICALFGPQVRELSAADVAERTGLNRTTAYRYCASMVAAGILERGSRRGTFALGGLMMEIGIHALGRRRVLDIASPFLRRLSAAARMTAVLSLRGAVGPVVALVEEDTSRLMVVTVHTGTKLDAGAAQSKVFLAHSDAAAFDALADGMTAAERALLRSEVDAARRQGFSVVRQSGGPYAVAAPVFDEQGLCATVAVLGAGDSDLSGALEHLLSTAAALTAEVGGPEGGPARADL